MTTKSLIFGVLLLVWSGGSGYWYICKIKQYCDGSDQQKEVNTTVNAKQTKDMESMKHSNSATLKVDTLETVSKVEKESEITLSTKSMVYYFAYSKFSYEFTMEEKRYLAELKTYMAAHADAQIEINGYADTKGSPAANMRYSKLRAEYFVKLLQNEGIEAQRIKMQYHGDSNAINTSADEQENARLSRRVELFVKP